jgi:sterol desaturase/sphingolipid hydroxylase (fatty acid hydroxylase superfamily)
VSRTNSRQPLSEKSCSLITSFLTIMEHLKLDEPAGLWPHLVSTYSPETIDLIGTFLIQFVFFWLVSAAYLSLDYVAPTFSEKHKIQPTPKQPSWTEIRSCALYVLRNQTMATVLQISLAILAKVGNRPPSHRFDATLPPLSEVVRDFTIAIILREILFYYSHRMLHLKPFYARIHKFHHRFTAPVALAAQYAHPIEHLLANVLPVALPCILLKSHILTFWIFLAFELFETATVHSGYDFLNGAAKKHDLHHEKFVMNFGALGFLDWMHGTDRLKLKER